MGQLNLEILESDFNAKSTSQYKLSILVGMDSLLYLVLDKNNFILFLRDYQFEKNKRIADKIKSITELIDLDAILTRPFQEVKIAFQNAPFSLVPTRLYSDENKEDYLSSLTQVKNPQTILTNDLSEINAKLVYELNLELSKFFREKFPAANFFHLGSSLILGGNKLANSQNNHSVFVDIRDNRVQVTLFEKKKLLLFNQNVFQSAKDAAYFVLLIFSQFKLNTEETPVWLSGQIVEDSELYTLFYRYIKNIRFVPSPGFLQVGKNFTPTQYHLYFDLFSISLCR